MLSQCFIHQPYLHGNLSECRLENLSEGGLDGSVCDSIVTEFWLESVVGVDSMVGFRVSKGSTIS